MIKDRPICLLKDNGRSDSSDMKFLNFPFGGLIFTCLDPDPLIQLNPGSTRIRNTVFSHSVCIVFRGEKLTNYSDVLQHRDYIMRSELDYQDIAMYFDRMVRGHDVDR